MAIYQRGKVYWLEYYERGQRKRRSLRCTRADVARRAADKILRGVEMRKAGILTVGEEAASVPIATHIAAFRASLRVSPQQEHQVMRTLNEVTAGMRLLRSFRLEAVNTWLRSEKDRGLSTTSLNHRRSHLIRFSRWLYETDRVASDPLKGLKKFRAAKGKDGGRFERRSLDDDELAALLRETPEPRRMVYLLAVTTGLRRGELAALKWASVDLDGAQLTVKAGTAKSGKEAHLPLAPEVVESLRAFRDRKWARDELERLVTLRARFAARAGYGSGERRGITRAAREEGVSESTFRRRVDRLGALLALPDEELVFPGGAWAYPEGKGGGVPSAVVLRLDLARAGVAVETPAGRIDFHALRTTFGTRLARAGVPLVVAQRLMRHSTPDLTAKHYTRVRSEDQRSAVASLVRGISDPQRPNLTLPERNGGRNCGSAGPVGVVGGGIVAPSATKRNEKGSATA